jgi:hypothetical protein
MRLTSTGLGVGTSSPRVRFQVTPATNASEPALGTANSGSVFTSVNTNYGLNLGVAATGYTWMQAMRFDGTATAYDLALQPSGGNVGIGTSGPAYKLDVNGVIKTNNLISVQNGGTVSFPASGYGWEMYSGDSTNNYLQSYNRTSSSWMTSTYNALVHRFFISGGEAARIDSSGNLLVGTTSNILSSRLTVAKNNSSTLAFFSQDYSAGNADNVAFVNGFATGSNNAVQCRFYNNALTSVGTITSSGSGTLYNVTSDYRLKTVTGALKGHGERIDLLEPIEYTWNANGTQAKGFLAHKFQEVYPSSVTGFKDEVDAKGKPVYQAMQASGAEVIADLVAEIQSLRKRLAAAGI